MKPSFGTIFGFAAVAVGALIIGAVTARHVLAPAEAVTIEPEAGCDLHRGPCTARFPGGGTLTLSIEPRPIPLLAPLTVEVRVADAAARAVELRFTSPDMYMGYHRHRLEPAGAGAYKGTVVLPVCVQNTMSWRARVLAHTERGPVSVSFTFVTEVPRRS